MPKTTKLQIRLTDDEKSLIEQAAKIRNMTTSQFVREQLLTTSKMMILVKNEELSEQSFLDFEFVRVRDLAKDAST